ncbi:MAG: RsmE family RNA methyltransferase [Spirochaetia bacterium]
MNILLVTPGEFSEGLPEEDHRVKHIRKVLRASAGDFVWVGIIGGPKILSELKPRSAGGFSFKRIKEEESLSLFPVTLLTGAVRPVVMKRIIRNTAMMGLEALWVCKTERSEKSYLRSSLWNPGGIEPYLAAGASQGVTTRIPEVRKFRNLEDAASNTGNADFRVFLDNYGPSIPLKDAVPPGADSSVIAVGSERGWSDPERQILEREGFISASLGPMVLSTEAACTAGPMLLLSSLGLLGCSKSRSTPSVIKKRP